MDVRYDKYGNCLKCNGTEKCVSCEGTGRNRFNEKVICPTCKGTGKCDCVNYSKKIKQSPR